MDSGVDAPALWLSVSALAAQLGISRQALSKRVDRLKAQGLIRPRPGPRNAVEINVAEFDRVIGETTDLARSTTHTAAPAVAATEKEPRGFVYTVEQARRVAYQADIAKLDLDERLGKLLPVSEVESAMVRVAEAMVRQIDQLPSRADDIATAVGVNGVNGARAALKAFARDLRETLARELKLLDASDGS
jgi:DNA-binding Lrp family transcriptional regulator